MQTCPLNLPDCAPCPHVAVPPRPRAYWRDLEALGLPVPNRDLTEIERALLDRLTAGPRGERLGDQPPPTGQGEEVWPEVISETLKQIDGLCSPEIVDFIVKQMRDRDSLGRARYGSPLRANNGRDACRDAREEALDYAAYSMQRIMECKNNPSLRKIMKKVFDTAIKNIFLEAIIDRELHGPANDGGGSPAPATTL